MKMRWTISHNNKTQQYFWLSLISCAAILATITIMAILIPVNTKIDISVVPANVTPTDNNNIIDVSTSRFAENRKIASIRSGFFKSSSPLRRRSTSDSVVEQILTKLELKYILVIKDKPVGFVKIQNKKGIEECRIGDNVLDMFRVLDIHPDQQYMDVEIAGQKLPLKR